MRNVLAVLFLLTIAQFVLWWALRNLGLLAIMAISYGVWAYYVSNRHA